MRQKPGKNTFFILLVSVLILVVVVVVVSKISPDGAQRLGSIPILSRYQQTPTPPPPTVASTSTSSPTATHSHPTASPTATPTDAPSHPTATATAVIAVTREMTPTATATAVITVTRDITPTQSEEPTPMAPSPVELELVAAILGEPEDGEWQIIPNLDLNQDGKRDEIIAYQPATLSLAPSFSDPVYQGYDLFASTFAILQQRQSDDLRILLNNTPEKIDAGVGGESVTFEDPPDAFLVKVEAKSRVPLTVIPINTEGERMMSGIGLTWSAQHAAYQTVRTVHRPEHNQ